MRKRTIFIIVLLLLAAGIAIVLFRNKTKINALKKAPSGNPKVSVRVDTVSYRDVTDQLQLLGTTIPIKEATVISEIQGTITHLLVKRGDFKTDDAELAQIRNQDIRASVASARTAYENAGKDLNRYRILYQGNAVTSRQLESARSSWAQAKANYEQSKNQLSKSVLKAPFAGTVTDVYVEKGSSVMSGTQILHIVDVSVLKVRLSVPEKEVYQLKTGNKVRVSTTVYPDTMFTGTITFISPEADQAHSYDVEVMLANPRGFPLKAGTYARVHFGIVSSERPLVISREALIGSLEEPQVYVVKNDSTAKLRAIRIGHTFVHQVEVTQGLQPGDLVVTTGLINLKDNTPVEIVTNNQ